jgi:hypothetical protein
LARNQKPTRGPVDKGPLHWSENADLLYDYADLLEKQHSQRVALDKACLRLLCPRPDLNAVQRNNRGDLVAIAAYEQFRRQGQNLSREITGSALAMTCQPMQVKVMPVGADAKLRQFCKQASQLSDGVFMANRFTELYQRVSEDSMWATVGAVKVFVDPRSSEIKIERVDPLGLFWDIYEGEQPLTIVQIHAVPKRRLMADYPDHASTIRSLPCWYPDSIPGVDYYGIQGGKPDTVRVVEGWAVKMGDTVGKHVIAVKGAVLTPASEQAYDDTDHDICTLRWDNDPRGFGGYSLIRGVAPFHAQIARYQRMRMEQLKACIPVIWVNDEEETFKNISDLEYQIARYSGDKPPEIKTAGAVSGDLTAEIEALRERCYQQHGVNFQVSTGVKPVGLNSAPAQREWLDTANMRLQMVQQRREQFWKDVANRVTRKAAVAYRSKGARVRAPGTDFLNEITWPKDLKEDQYQAVASAASGLSLTVSGKLDQLEVLTNLKVIEPEDVGQHVKLPDTESLQEMKSAPSDLALQQIDDNLEGNVLDKNEKPVFVSPSPHQDIPRALRLARANYQLALKRKIYKTDALQRLRRYIRKCESLMPALPPAPLPPGPGAAPNPATPPAPPA